MKAEPYYLVNDKVRESLIVRIMRLSIDGTVKITISNVGTKSAKQRGLQWKWYSEVAEAGIGGKHEDTKNGVHLLAKWRWALPILIRDDEFFSDLFASWKERHGNDEEAMRWFVDTQVSTEALSTSQMAEFLDDFQKHYGQLVNLTDPALRGL